MRTIIALLGFLVVIGCQDLTGLGGSCAAEMQSVRRHEGSPDRNSRTRQGGDFIEQWVYLASGGEPGRVYTFRWGTSNDLCEMMGPAPLNVIPGDDLLAAWLLPEGR